MIYRLRVFGWEVASIEVESDADEPSGITGGSGHNFERDVEPASPDDRYRWEWEEKGRFGFS